MFYCLICCMCSILENYRKLQSLQLSKTFIFVCQDPDQGLSDCVRQRHHVLQSQGSYQRSHQCWWLQWICQTTRCHHSQKCSWNQESWRYSLRKREHCSGDAGNQFLLWRQVHKEETHKFLWNFLLFH